MKVDTSALAADPSRRRLLLDIVRAALEAVDPGRAVRRTLRREGDRLWVGDTPVRIPQGGVVILGLGKASVPMARSVVEQLSEVPLSGVVVTHAPGPVPAGIEVIRGGHPLPDAGSVAGGRRLLDMAAAAGADRLVITLVSGGGSALAEVPARGLELDHLIEVNDALLRSGAPIADVNVVRRHLSALKGGRLAVAARPAGMVTLVVSDVVGNPLDGIASGPTVPDRTTFRDALAVVARYGVRLPAEVRVLLERGAQGGLADTPAGGDILDHQIIRIVADGSTAAEAARDAAAAQGVRASVVTTSMTGEAKRVGAAIAGELQVRTSPGVTISAGETTVTVTGPGRGGRNQELALAAGIALEGDPGAVVLSMGTDGRDGPTEAAGGFGDGETVERGRRAGRDAAADLEANDAGSFLAATGDRLVTGPTGTNVGDLVLALRSGPANE